MIYEWDFWIVLSDFDLLLLGLFNTLKITGLALVFGVPLGLLLALLRLYGNLAVRLPVGFIIEFLRTTPPIAQLFWFFFALPILIGVEINPFEASVLTFSLQSSAFFAEVFRGGIQSIDSGQWEASKALGMQRNETLRRIILPQAVKRMIPAFLERAIELMKTTTLVSTISYADLLYQTNNIAQSTYRTIEVFTIAAAMYFVVIFACSLAVRRLEIRLARTGETLVNGRS
jgi:polar amino acid transport system permease protein